MKNLNTISEDLFNKIRGRFPNLTIGDQDGNIVTEPAAARFFDFEYKEDGNSLGSISISLSEDDGISIIYSRDFINDQDKITQKNWYNFLKELREFAKKRLLNFDVRDINKTNLTKRDYKFLANRSRDGQMTESKLYGTSRISYQKVGEARIVIKHTESINQESATGRTQKIGKIYIESSDGERFRYPYKHLSGARAMARHVAEGGNTYDDFGKHIVGLSEEMGKLRKFKNYMGRSAVMAESLAGYVDVVKERIATVKKTIESLQKPAYYAETVAAFEAPMLEDVPADVKENWIDQLTIKQFNEELADVFPYIYKLVSEATRAAELGPDDLVSEDSKDEEVDETDNSKTTLTKEEIALEQGFEEMMGQFAEGNDDTDEGAEYRDARLATIQKGRTDRLNAIQKGRDDRKAELQKSRDERSIKNRKKEDDDEADLDEAYIKTSKDASDALGVLRGKGKKIETGDGEYAGNLANEYASEVWDVYSWIEARTSGFQGIDPKFQEAIDAMMALRKEAKKLETQPGSGKNGKFGNQIVNTLYPVMQYIDAHDFDKKEDDDTMDVKINSKGQLSKDDGTEEQKTPLGEFILSYFDRENGQFPKGETAVLTMVEKDYGEQFIEPAKAFIEQITAKFDEWQMRSQPQQMEAPDTGDYDRMRELAGLR